MKKLMVAVLAAAFIGGCGATPATVEPAPVVTTAPVAPEATPEPATAAPTEAPTPEDAPTNPPERAQPEPPDLPAVVPLGTMARVSDWDITVTGKVNFDAWPVVRRENQFNDPAPKGWKMVLIPLAMTNRGPEKTSLLGLGEYVYGEGTLIERTDFDDPTCGVIPRELDFFTDVRPGGTLKGNMCFVVDNSDVATLRFAVPQGWFSDEDDVEFALRRP